MIPIIMKGWQTLKSNVGKEVQRIKGFEDVQSSNLDAVKYDEEKLQLEVRFKGGSTYRYYDVPPRQYIALMNASSHGSYFYHNIRTSYAYTRL